MISGKLALIALLFASLLLFGCTQGNTNSDSNAVSNSNAQANSTGGIDLNNQATVSPEKTVEKGDTVKVEYIGTFPDTGEVFDKSEGRGPLEFTAGAGQMIRALTQQSLA
ncbi:MAG: FKBP-type peptidyl-prolyl cis-trans isomerase [Candidatus Diapherotrites archaeon]